MSLSGSSVPSENQTVLITLDSNISTLQDLITDIRNDLVTTGIGVDVREDPNSFGRLQLAFPCCFQSIRELGSGWLTMISMAA